MDIKVAGYIKFCESEICRTLWMLTAFLPLLPHSLTKAFMLHQGSLVYTSFLTVKHSIYNICSMYLVHIHLLPSPALLYPLTHLKYPPQLYIF